MVYKLLTLVSITTQFILFDSSNVFLLKSSIFIISVINNNNFIFNFIIIIFNFVIIRLIFFRNKFIFDMYKFKNNL